MSSHSVIAVIGAQGQLGADLMRTLATTGRCVTHADLDITDAESVRTCLAEWQPPAVINAAAYNWVDKAETEPDQAWHVNALGPRNLALACAQLQIPLMHISSDFVFGGARPLTSCLETDLPTPESVYAVSKLAGEYFVRSLAPRHFVVRTCGLYGHALSEGKGNFVKTMLRLGRERTELRIVSDQFCTPTATSDLVPALLDLLKSSDYGLYHATNAGHTSWSEFAAEIFRQAGWPVQVVPISTADFGAPAKRPAWSVLDCGKLERLRGCPLAPWPDALARYLTTVDLTR